MPDFDQLASEQLLTALDDRGSLFPQFRLVTENSRPKLMGSGGFSSVYEMENRERPGHVFALKVTGFERHTVSSEVFRSTCRIQCALSDESDYVVKVLDTRELLVSFDEGGAISDVKDAVQESWEEQDTAIHLQFVLMEKLEKVITKDRFGNVSLSESGLADEKEVLKFALEIGQALNLAHGYRVLHRDIKLENIFRDPEKQIYKLGDFGIARYVEDGTAETVVYTDGYGAPEIERRLYDRYNATADIYSFGISLYLLLNDLRFPGSSGYYPKVEVQYDPDYVFPAPAHASPEMTRVIRRMCSFRSGDRYQDMAEVLSDLVTVGEDTGTPVPDDLMDQISLTTETYRENVQDGHADAEQEQIRTRAEIREERRIRESVSRKTNVICFTALVLLLPAMFKGMGADAAVIRNPLFWLLPAAVFFEAVLQKIKDFHLLFGILTIALAVYSVCSDGLTLPHLVMILSMTAGCPLLTAASASGTGLWMLMEYTGRPAFSDFPDRHDLGWLFLTVVLLVINRYFVTRIKLGKVTYIRAYLGSVLFDRLSFVMIAAGIALIILKMLGVVPVPEVIGRIHLIRTGVITFAGMMFFNWRDGLFGDGVPEEETAHESVEADDIELDK